MTPEDRRIRALRPPKAAVDPWQPIAVLQEAERQPSGEIVPVLTVFLAGRECPFTCVFCDLWRHTLDEPTPPGALPAQLEAALARPHRLAPNTHIKLYNASNFFDTKAVPPADEEALLTLLAPFPQVVVECHPKLVGRRCLDFAARLAGRLQVAMGLETVHPNALPHLNKKMTPDDFAHAAATLRHHGMAVRAFVLIGAPFVPPAEIALAAEQAAAFAFAHGAEHVALIPARAGNGAMDQLAERGDFTPPSLAQIEEAMERCLALGGDGVVTVDLWDLERFAPCPACQQARLDRLARLNRSGRPEPALPCAHCS